VKESLCCFHHPSQVCHKHSERFVPRHHAMRDHSQSSYETTGRLWDQYYYPFLVFGSGLKLRQLLHIPYYFSLKNKNLEALSEVGPLFILFVGVCLLER
jgi:hypothetical protein